MSKKFLIVDSSFLAYRSYFAYPNLQNQYNVYTGAIFGFAKTVLQLTYKINPDFLIFTHDLQDPTFRHKALDEYKGNRKPMEDHMVSQMSLIRNFANSVTSNNFAVSGYEADDVIYSIVNDYNKEDNEFYIVSGDKDLFQLFVFDNVNFVTEERDYAVLFSREQFINKYSLEPNQWLDYKALLGDSSDNFGGVDGIGKITATKILQQCGNLYTLTKKLGMNTDVFVPVSFKNNIEEFTNNPKNAGLINKIKTNQEKLNLSYKLSKLAHCSYKNDTKEFDSHDFGQTLDLLTELDMISLVKYYNTYFGSKLLQTELF